MTDADQEREDEVLRRMLATKPKPHDEKKAGKAARERRNEGDTHPTRIRDR